MKNLFLLLSIGILFTLNSCAPTKTMVDTSCSGYKKIDFVRNQIPEKGIAVMPVLGGENKEQYRRPMGEELTNSLRNEFGISNVISPSQVIKVLNDNNLSDEYTAAITNYKISGIVPKELVNQLGKKLSVQYLLYVRLLTDTEFQQFFNGNNMQTLNVDELYIQSQVWDTRSGDVVWEGKGGVAKLDSDNSNVILKTVEGLTSVIGTERNSGPCEKKQELFNSVQKATINTYMTIFGVSTLVSIIILLAL